MKKSFFFFALIAIAFSACKTEDQKELDREIIEQYIADNMLAAESTESGLYYVIDVPGGTEKPSATDQVKVIYRGTFTNGEEFDKSPDQGTIFFLTEVIAGWTEGIPLFGEGGKGKLLVPSHLGYGRFGRGGIPGNAVLIFDIELLDF